MNIALLYKKLPRAVSNRVKSYDYLVSVLLGYYYKLRNSLFSRKAHCGKGLRVRDSLKIRGHGKVNIGGNVLINRLKPLPLVVVPGIGSTGLLVIHHPTE